MEIFPTAVGANSPTTEWKRRFRQRLLAWFRRAARDLAWRRSRDPYRVWVSEIMLQQTQVATVSEYYPRFLAAFPNIAALAAATEESVLRQWEGLGYYRRARQMHRAAGIIDSEHAGQFPHEIDAIRTLPGIGRYTAGAIASIAFDARQPILEANTVRLLSRLVAFRGDPSQAAGQELLWALAEELLPRRGCGEFNQALMELGSLVCTPRSPRCHDCPAMALCPTYRDGLQEVVPLVRRKPPAEAVREAAVVVRRRGRVLLLRRGESGRWGGLWDFPRFALASPGDGDTAEALIAGVDLLTGVLVLPLRQLTTLKHSVTRFRITLECHLAEYVSRRAARETAAEIAWVTPADLDDFPLSVTGRKLGRLISDGT
ncbi:MAG TPA: A/G-specific adenine glycosylase [Pirellulales bacterium]|nr:A/G-specific adenine glycosylase [Pirellulales bacterium]